MKKTEKVEKKKQKIDPLKIASRIIAGIMLAVMLIGAFYTVGYVLLNQ